MTFFKRLFSADRVVIALRGVAPVEMLAAQVAMRQHLEADVAADRAPRRATDVRPGGERTSRDLGQELGG